jgi:hypothetical protein
MEKTNKCPICSKIPEDGYRPFCSKRCADVDLGKWLNHSYAIPAENTENESASDIEETAGDD